MEEVRGPTGVQSCSGRVGLRVAGRRRAADRGVLTMCSMHSTKHHRCKTDEKRAFPPNPPWVV
jgi:hypothetical protein